MKKYQMLGLVLTLALAITIITMQSEIKSLKTEARALRFDNTQLMYQLEELTEVKEHYIPVKMSVTGYAPLDPNAIEGMCYEGDPRVTASGNPSMPGRSIAMGRSFPFGTEVYIPGFGYRVVEDRGGMIKDNNIDIMMKTQKEALEFGRREMIIFIKTN